MLPIVIVLPCPKGFYSLPATHSAFVCLQRIVDVVLLVQNGASGTAVTAVKTVAVCVCITQASNRPDMYALNSKNNC